MVKSSACSQSSTICYPTTTKNLQVSDKSISILAEGWNTSVLVKKVKEFAPGPNIGSLMHSWDINLRAKLFLKVQPKCGS